MTKFIGSEADAMGRYHIGTAHGFSQGMGEGYDLGYETGLNVGWRKGLAAQKEADMVDYRALMQKFEIQVAETLKGNDIIQNLNQQLHQQSQYQSDLSTLVQAKDAEIARLNEELGNVNWDLTISRDFAGELNTDLTAQLQANAELQKEMQALRAEMQKLKEESFLLAGGIPE